jgi:flagellar basal-body rod modification protein FlgD
MASVGSVLGTANNPTQSAGDTSTTSVASATDSLANESTFLQLLVTQLKNQDPTQPMDSTAFLGELAQFSQLEQLASINQDLQTGIPVTNVTPSTSTSSTAPTA